MKVYSIFFIQKEFAYHFYQKSEILYRFIQSYQRNEQDQDFAKQFDYITMDFAEQDFKIHLQNNLYEQISMTTAGQQIELSHGGVFLPIELHKRYLRIYCQSLSDAESMLFPLLRTFHPYAFVIGNEFTHYKNYGWIAPLVKNKLNKNSQILYSNS